MYRKVSPRDPDYANLSAVEHVYRRIPRGRHRPRYGSASEHGELRQSLSRGHDDQAHAADSPDQPVGCWRGGVSARRTLSPFIRSGSLKVMGYRMDGYYRRIENIKSYFNFDLDLLSEILARLCRQEPDLHQDARRRIAIYREGAPLAIRWLRTAASSRAALKTACCSEAYTSVAARVSRTASSCRTANIGEYAELENAILDKVVTVRRGERLVRKTDTIVVGKAVTV